MSDPLGDHVDQDAFAGDTDAPDTAYTTFDDPSVVGGPGLKTTGITGTTGSTNAYGGSPSVTSDGDEDSFSTDTSQFTGLFADLDSLPNDLLNEVGHLSGRHDLGSGPDSISPWMQTGQSIGAGAPIGSSTDGLVTQWTSEGGRSRITRRPAAPTTDDESSSEFRTVNPWS